MSTDTVTATTVDTEAAHYLRAMSAWARLLLHTTDDPEQHANDLTTAADSIRHDKTARDAICWWFLPPEAGHLIELPEAATLAVEETFRTSPSTATTTYAADEFARLAEELDPDDRARADLLAMSAHCHYLSGFAIHALFTAEDALAIDPQHTLSLLLRQLALTVPVEHLVTG